MEGHHALPMKYQDRFNHSLDIYSNVVCVLFAIVYCIKKQNLVDKYIMKDLKDSQYPKKD